MSLLLLYVRTVSADGTRARGALSCILPTSHLPARCVSFPSTATALNRARWLYAGARLICQRFTSGN